MLREAPLPRAIEELMRARGITRPELCNRIPISREGLNRILRGKTLKIRTDTLAGLARVLDVEIGMLYIEDPPHLPISPNDLSVYSIYSAGKHDLKWILDQERLVYPHDIIITQKRIQIWYSANPKGFFIERNEKGVPVGSVYMLPLKPDTMSAFMSGAIGEDDIESEHIYTPNDREKIDSIYISSVNTVSNTGKAYRALLAIVEHTHLMAAELCEPSQLKNVFTMVLSQEGANLVERLGFQKVNGSLPRRKDGCLTYSIPFRDLVTNILARLKNTVDAAEELEQLRERLK